MSTPVRSASCHTLGQSGMDDKTINASYDLFKKQKIALLCSDNETLRYRGGRVVEDQICQNVALWGFKVYSSETVLFVPPHNGKVYVVLTTYDPLSEITNAIENYSDNKPNLKEPAAL